MSRMLLPLMFGLIAVLNSCSSVGSTPSVGQDKQQGAALVDSWIQKLHSADGNERQAAKSAILSLANESAQSRQYAVKELIRIAKVPNGCIEVLTSNERFSEWDAATDILGTLKAPEAIAALTETLDCSKATSLSLDSYPAAKAIAKIGREAVPQLAAALDHKPVRVRFVAAQALYRIGGEEAKAALIKAQGKETDKVVANMIKDMLRDWSSRGHSGI
ncbi:MAG: HEAT repeat domain-containing protein [Pyrinomonadaceae bacterium]